MISTRAQNVLIASLAALALAASGYAIWSVRQPHPSLQSEQTIVTTAADTEPTTNPPAATPSPTTERPTATPSPTTTSDAEVMTSTPPATVSETTEQSEPPPSVEGWTEAWSGDGAHLLVLGDGYSNARGEWIHLWGLEVGQDRPVELHHWAEAQDEDFREGITLSEAEGPALTIWNASRAGTTIAAAAEGTDRFLDAADGVDAVLVSLGLSSAREDVAASLDLLISGLGEDLPVLVLVGPAGLYEPQVGDGILDWAQANDDRVSVVDLRDTTRDFATAEQWAWAFDAALAAS